MRIAKPVIFCLTLFCTFFSSCGTSEKDLAKSLAGNWLILYPDHRLTTAHQREVYAKYQDSILALYGLKLITLDANGSFKEIDSLEKPPGKWMISQDSLLKIREAGKGFNPFNTALTNLKDSELLLTQYLPLQNEKIKVVWHLKRLEEDSLVAKLFSSEANAWRKIPLSLQSIIAIKKRLAAMLNYYADYFDLVGKSSAYFAPGRVPLPFRYYQHGMGLKTEMPVAFVNLFYNEAEAATAYNLLAQALNLYKDDFSWGENLVQEYSAFFRKLAGWMSRDYSR
ncbi:hypothetical protein [Flavisolibacter ginsenosidimutans]|uniref:Uncharacterized protein n=1 Tax=Flavisolibacter ginsenosidimutans TaxID=661481 RepID=A0A5B8UIJ2_9BACT|nr:hypothetical protein [Flavisolibacter ginsenosidimutans]QEC56353.1 hypothetical protein FSB75_10780 [Flavisolibacter ginsenosidimutans]